jgi:hypothetical protein
MVMALELRNVTAAIAARATAAALMAFIRTPFFLDVAWRVLSMVSLSRVSGAMGLLLSIAGVIVLFHSIIR